MKRDSITGKMYSTQKVVVSLTEGKEIIILSDKLSRREVVNDIFDYIDFDTSKMQGSGIATIINGHEAQYTEALKTGDKIEVFWKK